jgi:hypothetical protein
MTARDELQHRLDRGFDGAVLGYIIGAVCYAIAMILAATILRGPNAEYCQWVATVTIIVISGGLMVRALLIFACVSRDRKRLEEAEASGHQH